MPDMDDLMIKEQEMEEDSPTPIGRSTHAYERGISADFD
jgi:hypothetical protein